MAEPSSNRKPHFPNPALQQHTMKNQAPKSKSCSHFLFKALFFSIFLVLVPLFPSQAPEFINQSIITKLWELIHLLFIGIAVSYGLFCRRNVDDQVSFESTTHSKIDNLQYDMSSMFHVSSVFEDGYEGNPCVDTQFPLVLPRVDLNSSVCENSVENPCGYVEKSDVQGGKFNPNFLVSENDVGDPGGYYERSDVQAGKFNPNFSFSGNGLGNLRGFGENDGIQAGNFNPNFSVSGNGLGSSHGFGEKFYPGFSVSGNGFGNPCGYGEKSVVQAWNAQYFHGESMVVVAEPNCGVGEWGEPASIVDYKPLGLPVRSLRSRISKGENGDVLSGNDESDFGSGDSYRSCDVENRSEKFGDCDVESRSEKFGDLGPRNLEENFDEAAVMSPSPIPWRSRSGRRREVREKPSAVSRPSSHFRPLSVDDTRFESLRTPSLRSRASFSSNASSMSSSQGDESPSPTVASEVVSLKMEDDSKAASFRGLSSASSGTTSPPKRKNLDVRKGKTSQGGLGSSVSNSPSPPKPVEDKVSCGALHMRGHSFGSLYENDSKAASFRGSSSASSGTTSPPKQKNLDVRKGKTYQGGLGSSVSNSPSPPRPVEDKVSSGGLHMRGHSFGSLYENDLRSAKDYLKEVRESRSEDLLDKKESGPSALNLEKKPRPPSLRKTSLRGKSVRTVRSSKVTTVEAENCEEKKGNRIEEHVETTFSRNEEVASPANGSSKQNFDTLPEYQKRETQELSENVSTKREEHVESEGGKFQLSSGEDADTEYVGSATPEYTSEVDKKAGEFIAKFREQIRLQKVASIERSRGLRLGSNYVR